MRSTRPPPSGKSASGSKAVAHRGEYARTAVDGYIVTTDSYGSTTSTGSSSCSPTNIGGPQSSFDAISAYEWKDLTFFARPTPEMDRQYEVALEQALAQLVSPVELRSLSKHRLAWRDVECWRADVIRAWSQASPLATQNEAGGEPRSDSVGTTAGGSPVSRLPTSRPAPLSAPDFRSWYKGRVAELKERGETSSGEKDWQAVKRQFPGRVRRTLARAVRDECAPAEWKKQGRRSPPTAD